MSVQNGERLATKQDLADMYQEILPYLGGSADAGFTPVGSIIAIMGVTAPANYLACNGQIVNVADYPELANYFQQQFGTKYKFGGSGTTFGIPDLRGEFLRGTGTNGHTGQGSGSAVGTHQNATEHVELRVFGDSGGKGRVFVETPNNTASSTWNAVEQNADSTVKQTNRYAYQTDSKALTTYAGANDKYRYMSRPTNTSILWCIATKNIYLNPSLDYSTDEKVVGTWIDGSTLYQKTINFGALPNATAKKVAHGITNLKNVVEIKACAIKGNATLTLPDISTSNTGAMRILVSSDNNIQIDTSADRSDFTAYVTLQYTKTTT